MSSTNRNNKRKSGNQSNLNGKRLAKEENEILCTSPNQTFDINYKGLDRGQKKFNEQREKLRIIQISSDYSRLVEYHYRHSSKYTISAEALVKKFKNRMVFRQAADFYYNSKLADKVKQLDEFEAKYGKESLKRCEATNFLDKKHLNLTFLSKSSLKNLLPTLQTAPVAILSRTSSLYSQSSQSSFALPEEKNPIAEILSKQEQIIASQTSDKVDSKSITDASQSSQNINTLIFKPTVKPKIDYESKSFCCRELSEGYIDQLKLKNPEDPAIAEFYKLKNEAHVRAEEFMPTVRAELSKMVYDEKRYYRPGYETPIDEFTTSGEEYGSSDSDGNEFFRIALNRKEAILGIESNVITRTIEAQHREKEFEKIVLEEKRLEKIELQRRDKFKGKPRFEDSFEIPLDLTLKNGITITSTFPFEFAGFTPENKYGQAELMALANFIHPTHDLLTNTYDLIMKHPYLEGKRDTPSTILTSLYNQLVTYQLPQPRKLSRYTQAQEDAIFNTLSTRRSNRNSRRLSFNPNSAIIQHFDNEVSLWVEGFKNLFELVQRDINPYFYYINEEFSVLFVSAKFRSTLQKQPTAGKSEDDNKESGMIAMMYLKDCTLPTANILRQDGVKFRFVEHEEEVIHTVLYYTGSHPMSPPRGLDPPSEQRLVFQGEDIQKLFKYVTKWQNPDLKQHIRKLPSLISPIRFRNAHLVLPKLWYNEPRLFQPSQDPFAGRDIQRKDSYEIQVEGTILPTALHQVTYLLKRFGHKKNVRSEYDPEAEFHFRVETSLNLHTCAFFGRWMVPDPECPLPKQPLDETEEVKLNTNNDFILLHNYVAGYQYKNRKLTWPREM